MNTMGKRKRLAWHLYPPYLIMTVLAVGLTVLFAGSALDTLSLQFTSSELESEAHLVSEILEPAVSSGNSGMIQEKCADLSRKISSRITVIDTSGKVLGDSSENPAGMGDHSSRPEVRAAFGGAVGTSTRYSANLGTTMVYVALPMTIKGRLAGAVRTSMPMAEISHAVNTLWFKVIIDSVCILILGVILSLYIAHLINKPIHELQVGVAKFSAGELDYRISPAHYEEISNLSDTMNKMAEQLRQNITTLERQRNELENVLSSMTEAVFVVDGSERVVRINKSAERIFGIDGNKVQGKKFFEVLRNAALCRFVSRTLAEDLPISEDIDLIGHPERFFQANGTRLKADQGKLEGALIVLNDVTKLKKLEQIRKDFVANVSHELKTPLTPIKGFLETLKEEITQDPENSLRFLEKVISHTNRLSALVEDLLALARLEDSAENRKIDVREESLEDVLETVKTNFSEVAADRGVELVSEVRGKPYRAG